MLACDLNFVILFVQFSSNDKQENAEEKKWIVMKMGNGSTADKKERDKM